MSIAPTAVPGLHPAINELIVRFTGRRRWLLLLRSFAAGILTIAVAAVVIMAIDAVAVIADHQRWALSVMGYVAALYAAWRFGWRRIKATPRQIAQEIQFAQPVLRDDVLSAIDLAGVSPFEKNGDSYSFRQRAQQRTAKMISRVDVLEALPWRSVQNSVRLSVVVMITAMVCMAVSPSRMGRRFARALLPGVSVTRVSTTTIEIVEPSPASTDVAIGDSVAVVARVDRLGDSSVQLQWQDDDAPVQRAAMSIRSRTDQPGDDGDPSSGLFAANVTIGSTPIRYRVVGGDAVTFWQTLTPKARPRVVDIEKRYRYPDYAGVPDRTERSTIADDPSSADRVDGDLTAIAGTIATVKLRFDTPVRDAVIRIGSDAAAQPVAKIGPDTIEVEIPIQNMSTYSVDATALDTGLNQPLAPQYQVMPTVDQPPSMRWRFLDQPFLDPSLTSDLAENAAAPDDVGGITGRPSRSGRDHPLNGQIVNRLDVLDLSAIAVDDLPIDLVVQEIQINNDPLFVRRLDVTTGTATIHADWQFDLTNLVGSTNVNPERFRRLTPGDIVRTRVVAIDRLGQRGETDFLEFLIADEGYDPDRHQAWAERSKLIAQWLDFVSARRSLLQSAAAAVAEIDDQTADDFLDQWKQPDAPEPSFDSIVDALIADAPSQWHSHRDRHLAAAMDVVEMNLQSVLPDVEIFLGESLESDSPTDFKAEQKRFYSQLNRLANDYDPIESSLRNMLQLGIGRARVDEAIRLLGSLDPLVQYHHASSRRPKDSGEPPIASLPIERYPRYIALAMSRLVELSQLGYQYKSYLSQNVLDQMSDFERFVELWNTDLQSAAEDLRQSENLRSLVLQFEIQLRRKIAGDLVERQTPQSLTRAQTDLSKQSDAIAETIRDAAKIGKQSLEQWKTGSAEAASRDADQFAAKIAGTIERLQRDAARGRKQATVDLVGVADQMLLQSALENVTRQGYGDHQVGDVMVDDQTVYQEIAAAANQLSVRADLLAWQAVMAEMAKIEQNASHSGEMKLIQPQRIDDFLAAMPLIIDSLTNNDFAVDRAIRNDPAIRNKQADTRPEQLASLQYNDVAQSLRTALVSRRWSAVAQRDEPIDRAEKLAGQLADQLRVRTMAYDDDFAAARKTLQKYVESISQQARRAAETAKRAARKTAEDENREQEAEQNAEQDAEKATEQATEQAIEAAGQLMQTLIDRANTPVIGDENSSVRDADAASAVIGDQRRRVMAAARQADLARAGGEQIDRQPAEQALAQSLDNLAERLDQVADAFDQRRTDPQRKNSLDQLRRDAAVTTAERQLEAARAAAEMAAETFASDPESVLAELEDKLADDLQMQNELSRIAKSAIETAAESLDRAAVDQRQIREDLENGNEDVVEEKRAVLNQLRSIGKLASAANDTLLNRVAQAASRQHPQNAEEQNRLRSAVEAIAVAKKSVNQSIDAINQIDSENVLLESFAETVGDIADDLIAAQQLSSDAASEMEPFENFDDIPSDAAAFADQTRRQMKQMIRAALTEQARTVRSQQEFWKQVASQSNRQKRDVQQQIDALERTQRRIEQSERATPSDAEIEDQRIELEQLGEKEKVFESNASDAMQRSRDAEELKKRLLATPLPPLDSNQPAAQTAGLLSQSAANQLGKLAGQVAEIERRLGSIDTNSNPIDTAAWDDIGDQQSAVSRTANDAVDDLMRASRHEARMQRGASALTLDQTARQISGRTEPALRAAGEEIEDLVSGDGDADPSGAVKEAEQALVEAANVARGAGAEDAGAEQVDAEQTDSASRSADLAKQLDEIDRAISGSNDRPDASQEESSQEDSSQGQTSPGQASASEPAAGSPPTAGQISPTMRRILQEKLQAAAQQRQQRLAESQSGQNDGDGESQQNEPSSSDEPSTDQPPPDQPSSNQSDASGDEASSGDANLSIESIDRSGGDWGDLRVQRGDDADTTGRPNVPSIYRRQIEAYFQAIASESAGGNR